MNIFGNLPELPLINSTRQRILYRRTQHSNTRQKVNTMDRKVFVYGTLRPGHHNNYLLTEGACLHGTCKTVDKFTMKDVAGGGFPGVVDGDTSQITGELYLVNGHVAHRLDRLEGFPRLYTRRIVELDNGESAWMYIFNSEHDRAPVIRSGDWNEYRGRADIDDEPHAKPGEWCPTCGSTHCIDDSGHEYGDDLWCNRCGADRAV